MSKIETSESNESTLIDYQNAVITIKDGVREAQVTFMQASVESGVAIRPLKASVLAGQIWAKSQGFRALPEITLEGCEYFGTALALLAKDLLLTVSEALKLAKMAQRAFTADHVASKIAEMVSVEQLKKDIKVLSDAKPVKAGKSPSAGRKGSTTGKSTTPTFLTVESALDFLIEHLPEDLNKMDSLDLGAIVRIARKMSALNKTITRLAKVA